jgi:hypothetical protein
MKLLIKLKTGEEGFIVGYGPGKKGRPLAIVVVNEKLRAVKLRGLELVGVARIKATKQPEVPEVPDISHFDWDDVSGAPH